MRFLSIPFLVHEGVKLPKRREAGGDWQAGKLSKLNGRKVGEPISFGRFGRDKRWGNRRFPVVCKQPASLRRPACCCRSSFVRSCASLPGQRRKLTGKRISAEKAVLLPERVLNSVQRSYASLWSFSPWASVKTGPHTAYIHGHFRGVTWPVGHLRFLSSFFGRGFSEWKHQCFLVACC